MIMSIYFLQEIVEVYVQAFIGWVIGVDISCHHVELLWQIQ